MPRWKQAVPSDSPRMRMSPLGLRELTIDVDEVYSGGDGGEPGRYSLKVMDESAPKNVMDESASNLW